MGLFDMFRRPAPIAAREDLMDFLDSQSAFLGQKGVYEYSRALAGPHGNVLFKDRKFIAAAEKARWQAYPVAMAMVGEVVEGVLRPAAGNHSQDMLQALISCALDTIDRYPVPPDQGEAVWAEALRTLKHDFNSLSLHPVKRVMDIPTRFIDRYMEVMPIHPKLRGKDTQTIFNYLKFSLGNMHDVFVKRADIPALVGILIGAH